MLHPVCRVPVSVGAPPGRSMLDRSRRCVCADANGARPGRPATHASVQCACVLNLALALFLMRPCGLVRKVRPWRRMRCGGPVPSPTEVSEPDHVHRIDHRTPRTTGRVQRRAATDCVSVSSSSTARSVAPRTCFRDPCLLLGALVGALGDALCLLALGSKFGGRDHATSQSWMLFLGATPPAIIFLGCQQPVRTFLHVSLKATGGSFLHAASNACSLALRVFLWMSSAFSAAGPPVCSRALNLASLLSKALCW